MRRRYRDKYDDPQARLDRIAGESPEFVNELRERLGRKLLLTAGADALREEQA
jgi:hypothetical protein